MSQEEQEVQEEKEPHPEVRWADRLVHLDNGTLLITRIITNHDKAEQFIYCYRPVEIQIDEVGNPGMFPWIPESSDDFYLIPVIKVLNLSNPRPEFLQAYHNGYFTPVGENENDSQEGASEEESSEGYTLH